MTTCRPQRCVPTPSLVIPFLRALYELHYVVIGICHRIVTMAYQKPLMQGRASALGNDFSVGGLPQAIGGLEIQLGEGAILGGQVTIRGNRQSRLVLFDGSGVGDGTTVVAQREVILEERAIVSTDCWISDTDSWPDETGAETGPQPVRIGHDAWVGNGARVLKGVTIGAHAIIGANSVVVSDIPAYSLAMGNPAEVYFRNLGRAPRRGGDSGAAAR